MVDVQIKLSAAWAALMLTYLLGDVLRIFSGDGTAKCLQPLQLLLKNLTDFGTIGTISNFVKRKGTENRPHKSI